MLFEKKQNVFGNAAAKDEKPLPPCHVREYRAGRNGGAYAAYGGYKQSKFPFVPTHFRAMKLINHPTAAPTVTSTVAAIPIVFSEPLIASRSD